MLTLKDIMAPTVFRVEADTTIRDAARIMASIGSATEYFRRRLGR